MNIDLETLTWLCGAGFAMTTLGFGMVIAALVWMQRDIRQVRNAARDMRATVLQDMIRWLGRIERP